MTTLIFDWSELLGRDATGVVRVRATRWRYEPDTLVVPWSRDLSFSGRETLDVDAGLVLELEWRPEGVTASLAQTIVVPDEGEHFAHLLAVDPSSLEPAATPPALWTRVTDELRKDLDALAAGGVGGGSVDLAGYATEDYVDAAVAAIPAPAPSSLLMDPETGDYYMEA